MKEFGCVACHKPSSEVKWLILLSECKYDPKRPICLCDSCAEICRDIVTEKEGKARVKRFGALLRGRAA